MWRILGGLPIKNRVAEIGPGSDPIAARLLRRSFLLDHLQRSHRQTIDRREHHGALELCQS